MAELFLDTAYAIALITPNDVFHARASQFAERLAITGPRVVTTRAVLLEIGSALARQRYRAAAVRLLRVLEADPQFDVIALSGELYSRVFHLYSTRPDKEWGLVDCLSFTVMWERGIADALTSDEHFQQAGFRALLREGLP